jgi:tyrosine-protein phosphatase SIW14
MLRKLVTMAVLLGLAPAGLAQNIEPAQAPATQEPAKGLTTASQEVAKAHVKAKEDLPNFHQVHPYLYRGGEPTTQGLKQLKDMGIKTIIDLRGSEAQVNAEAEQAKKLGMQSINLPMSSKPPTPSQIDTMMKTIKAAEKDPLKGPVFVHCAHGSDRTGAMIGLWRVVHDGWDYDTTYKEMRKYWFTPKFTQLSGTVKQFADKQDRSNPAATSAANQNAAK